MVFNTCRSKVALVTVAILFENVQAVQIKIKSDRENETTTNGGDEVHKMTIGVTGLHTYLNDEEFMRQMKHHFLT